MSVTSFFVLLKLKALKTMIMIENIATAPIVSFPLNERNIISPTMDLTHCTVVPKVL